MKQVIPALKKASFSCPHCQAIAAQRWYTGFARLADGPTAKPSILDSIDTMTEHLEMLSFGEPVKLNQLMASLPVKGLRLSKCFACSQMSVWVGQRVVWPDTTITLAPDDHLPSEIRADFIEAAAILSRSPRGAAALLRLALQKLINDLVGEEIAINDGIQKLVDAGLPKMVQQACDYVRIVGNDAVHPGTIDLRDNTETATRLFTLINLIAVHTIGFQATMAEIYPDLPAAKLKGVEDRMMGAKRKQEAISTSAPLPVLEDKSLEK